MVSRRLTFDEVMPHTKAVVSFNVLDPKLEFMLLKETMIRHQLKPSLHLWKLSELEIYQVKRGCVTLS
uniref:Porin domain, eukaryotic porin/Tom40 n=1 Tax=Tanacetum cinerariifolium TaxID=118510 RepID=A0A6L2J5V4_TANCI|nr:porin domain, eukaryotic porin/Tom40 [Tanacetum cinerariifolium]